MTHGFDRNDTREGSMTRRLLTIGALCVAVLLVGTAAAYAEGYNQHGSGQTYGGLYTRESGYFSGPHGGYTTTTNKCQDCHSTHYASGSFMLLRANSREAACDYCHGGGGGSQLNIMMDNDYRTGTYDMTQASAIPTTTMGFGTGHTLGYRGKAPADIQPAYSDPQGFSCFDCHTPHGNSARVLEAFGSPSHPAGSGYVDTIYGVTFMDTQMYRLQEMLKIDLGTGMGQPAGAALYPADGDLTKLPGAVKRAGNGTPVEIGAWVGSNLATELATTGAKFQAWMADPVFAPTASDIQGWAMTPGNIGPDSNGDGYSEVTSSGFNNLMALFMGGTSEPGSGSGPELVELFQSWYVYWGVDVDEGNIDTCFLNMGDWQNNGGVYMPMDAPELEVWHKPLFGKGRFLLLKNPDQGDDVSGMNDLGMPSPDMDIAQANKAPAGKKFAIDWQWPLGPAASWGPFFSTNSNERFPLAFPWAPKGVAMENEMCTSCHDGAAGLSDAAATVWKPDASDTSTGTYVTAYSHDSNSRGCARQQYLNPSDDDNFGPHCANCHTGASGCRTCHSEDGENWEAYGRPAYTSNPASATLEGVTTYKAPAAVRTRAATGISARCLDGGFSYPHRTLGVNMLKDNLWGVNFDGTPVAAGQTRTMNGVAAYEAVSNDLDSWFDTSNPGRSFESTAVLGQVAHNLDSVCIDCHGDATYWTGDRYESSFTSYNPLNPSQSWTIEGWNLLLKGLP